MPKRIILGMLVMHPRPPERRNPQNAFCWAYSTSPAVGTAELRAFRYHLAAAHSPPVCTALAADLEPVPRDELRRLTKRHLKLAIRYDVDVAKLLIHVAAANSFALASASFDVAAMGGTVRISD